MSIDRPHQDKPGFLPNPHEVVPPPTERAAYEDTMRYMASLMAREDFDRLVNSMGSQRVVQAVQGMVVQPRLNPIEAALTTTLGYCERRGLVVSPVGSVTLIESVRQDVLESRSFIGNRLTTRVPLPPRTQ